MEECKGYTNKRKRYDTGVVVSKPLLLNLRYEDASVNTPYVSWSYNFATPIQGYSKATIRSVKLYNNYTDRLAYVGVRIDKFSALVKGGSSTNNVATSTWVLPNSSFSTSAFTLFTFDAFYEWPAVDIRGQSLSNLTLSLYNSVSGNLLTAAGAPGGFFCEILLEFS